MPWDSCVITLNSDSTGSLYTGDIVTGFVTLEFKQFQKIEQINFLVYGKCKASWTSPMPVTPYICIYSEKKKILYIDIDLFENLKGTTVKAGVYGYPFHFALPNDLPSSFESSIGKVNYKIKIKSGSVKAELPFVVRSTVNVNHVDRLLEPSYHELHKKFWNTGTIAMTVKTYTAFASNQIIPVDIAINNSKRIKISRMIIALVQKLHYNITDGHYDNEKIKCKLDWCNLKSVENETCNMSMEIPHLIPSSIHTTDPLIDISYVLRVTVKFLYHRTLCEDIPVTVATVPVLHHDFNEDTVSINNVK